MNEVQINLSRSLRALRKDRGLSQRELAKALGLSNSSIALYESGDRAPSFEVLCAMSAYFNVPVTMLVGNERSAAPQEAEEILKRPGMRILFDAAKDAPDSVLQKTADLLEALKNGSGK